MTISGNVRVTVLVSMVCMACLLPGVAQGSFLSIPEIQYTESPDGASPFNGQVVDCAGGVVVFIRAANRPRLVLYDPNAADGWGGIQVKGWAADAFDEVNVGDWVEMEQAFVEEANGVTFLQYWDENPDGSQPLLRVVSRDHTLPRPLPIDVNEIKTPVYLADEDAWVAVDHGAERFESMIVQVRDVVVTTRGLGKALDNYELQSIHDPNDPNASCWAADFYNPDRAPADLYLPAIEEGRRFRAVTGLLEQYTKLSNGYDYYQLMTLGAEGMMELCPADLNQDGDVDLWDYRFFTEQLLAAASTAEGEPCIMADLNCDGTVDATDLDLFNAAWQDADVNGDGIVDGDDLD